MQRSKWLGILSRTTIAMGLLLVTELVRAQDIGSSKDLRGKETPAAGQQESRRRPEPSLLRELRNERFDEKLKLTNEQRTRLGKLSAERNNAFRALMHVEGSRQELANRHSEMLTLSKTYDEKMLEVLTSEQKVIWEGHKQEVITSGIGGSEISDRARIHALEVEVESLKAEVAKLKAAIEAMPATKAP